MTTQIAAIDPGFGNFKVGWRNGQLHIASFPSAIGLNLGQADLGLLATGLNGRRRQVKPYHVEFDGVGYLVGPNVHRWGRPIERLDFQRLFEGLELRALTYVALAAIAADLAASDHPAADLSLLIGLPVEILQDRAKGQATLTGLKSWLLGRHQFCVDGRPYDLEVAALKAMAQPLGSYFAWGLGETGDWARPAADFNVPVAVADIGFNTLDLFGIERGQVISRLTGGKALGMHRAAAAVARHARALGLDLSLGQADELIRDHLNGRPALLHQPAGSVEINPVVQQALNETFAAINEFLREHWNAGGFRYLILTGGGAESLRQQLLNHYPAAVFLPDPVTANVSGLARFAHRLFKPA